VPFREVPYAEDRVLAIDMLRAGYAKAFLPDAVVVHSHDYTPLQELRRCFDEWRGLSEVYGWHEPAGPRALVRRVRGELSGVRIAADRRGLRGKERRSTLRAASRHHVLRLAGALLGSRAAGLPPSVRRGLSLERRPGFAPLDLDAAGVLPSIEHDSQSSMDERR
jgi:rhamnosyltransferase